MNNNLDTQQHDPIQSTSSSSSSSSPQSKLNQTLPVKEIDIDVQRPVIHSSSVTSTSMINQMKRSELSTINDQSLLINSSPSPLPPGRLDENNNEMLPTKQNKKNEITLITANINITTRLNNTNHHHSTPKPPPTQQQQHQSQWSDSKQTPVQPSSSSSSSVANSESTHNRLMMLSKDSARIQQLYGVKEANVEVQRLAISSSSSNSQVRRTHFNESTAYNRSEPVKSPLPPSPFSKILNQETDHDIFDHSKLNEEFPPESESIYITPDTSPSNIMDESRTKEDKSQIAVAKHYHSPYMKQEEAAVAVASGSAKKSNIVSSSRGGGGGAIGLCHQYEDDGQYLYLYLSSDKYARIFERRFIELDRLIHDGKFMGAIVLTSLPPTMSDMELLSELYGVNVLLDRRSVQCYIKLRRAILDSFKNALIQTGPNKYLFTKNICFTTSFPKHEFRANYQA